MNQSVQEMMLKRIQEISLPIEGTSWMDPLIESIGDARYVLLGEATHGTSEFYTYRAQITKKLIKEKGFSFVAVEGDWPSCYELNRFIKSPSQAEPIEDVLIKEFGRWPTWMWSNQETAELLSWMKEYNGNHTEQQQIGFYGIDVYSLWESMEEIISYLEDKGPEDLEVAKKAFLCFQPYAREGQNYGVMASFSSESCEDEVVELLTKLRSSRKEKHHDDEEALSAELNALVAVHAEQYYRSMIQSDSESWNVRDRHMVDVLNKLMTFHGNDAKVIVWEHNTHVGDARATDMAEDGMVNVGQLLREQAGKEVYTVGFGTHRGTVIAADSWGAPLERINVPASETGSWEDLLYQHSPQDQLLLFEADEPSLSFEIGHRAIGVVYDPAYEMHGNYVPTIIPERYDAFIYVDQSKALEPLVSEPAFV
jgi:erythromycin esterase-like protein